jgi:hypothetical protein
VSTADGFDAPVRCLKRLAGGDVLVAGEFTRAGGAPVSNIAVWDGRSWLAIGAGLDGPVRAAQVMPDGSLVVGGEFTHAGGGLASHLARWDGTRWSAFAGGAGGPVYAFAMAANGDLIAGGAFPSAGITGASRIARWNGSVWSAFGPGFEDTVYALLVTSRGEVYAGGRFVRSGGGLDIRYVSRWDGAEWRPTGSWSQDFNTEVNTLAELPGGDIVAGGVLTAAGGTAVRGIARWDGSGWSPFGDGAEGRVSCVLLHPGGELVVGGEFLRVGAVAAGRIARWTPTGAPWLARPPADATFEQNRTLTLSAAVSPGLLPLRYEWRRNGVPIHDGPGGASPGGGFVEGARGSLPGPPRLSPVVLTIHRARIGDAGGYSVVFGDDCGSAVGGPAAVEVLPASCAPDFNADGFVDFFDYSGFVAAFEAGC